MTNQQKEMAGKHYLIADLYSHGFEASIEQRSSRRGTSVVVNGRTAVTVLTRFVDRDEPGQDQYIFGDDPPTNETPLYVFVRVFPEEQGVQCHEVYIALSVHIIQASIQRRTNYIRNHPGVDPQRQPYTISLTDLQPFRNNWAALQLAT